MDRIDSWDLIIKSKTSAFNINIPLLWRYRDLVLLFIKRDFVTIYKQTVLGPIWFFLQPLLTTIIFTIIFGNVASLPTEGIPKPLFYLSGVILWTYFSESLMKTSETFISNQNLFSKVYFPRIVVPISIVISNLLKLAVQFVLFIILYLYFLPIEEMRLNTSFLLIPLLVFIMAGLGLGFGLLVSSLTFKYRDLRFLIQFGVQLAMYASPVVFPLSIVPSEYATLIKLNPVTGVIEAFRAIVFNGTQLDITLLIYSGIAMGFILIVGIILFNRIEKSFIDTV